MAGHARYRRHRRGVLDRVVSRWRTTRAARCLLMWSRAVKSRRGLAHKAFRVGLNRRRHAASEAFGAWVAVSCGRHAFERRLGAAYRTFTSRSLMRAMHTWRGRTLLPLLPLLHFSAQPEIPFCGVLSEFCRSFVGVL